MERWTSTLTLLCVVWSGVAALTVTIPKTEYEFARGDNITLPCSFKTIKTDPKVVVISWTVQAAVVNAKETLILTHYYPSKTTDIKSQYEGRVSLDQDIKTGKANLKLSSITLADNKIFECRIQIPGDDEGIPVDTARLVVLVAPSPPICKIQGTAEYGQNINLTCYSEEGSPPPTYKWDSQDVQRNPRIPDPRTTDKGGILSLYNITKDTSGYYVCTSRNKIRSSTCNITVTVMPPSMNIGSTAGIIAAVVIFLIILIIVIYCCCCRKKKEKEEEYAMGKREEEYHDKEPDRNGEGRQGDGGESTRDYDDSSVRSPIDRRDQYEERSERDYDRRSDYNDRRSDYDDRRSDYDDRRSDYDNRREKYGDRHERYDDDHRYDDDERRYNDRRDQRYEDDDRYDDRDRAPSNKSPRRDDDY